MADVDIIKGGLGRDWAASASRYLDRYVSHAEQKERPGSKNKINARREHIITQEESAARDIFGREGMNYNCEAKKPGIRKIR